MFTWHFYYCIKLITLFLYSKILVIHCLHGQILLDNVSTGKKRYVSLLIIFSSYRFEKLSKFIFMSVSFISAIVALYHFCLRSITCTRCPTDKEVVERCDCSIRKRLSLMTGKQEKICNFW